ncbi:MAG: DinB family protein [Candidatus Dormibacteria bacterium]
MPRQRPEPPEAGDERSTLEGFLDYQRATLAWKCEGLSEPQLKAAAVPPSNLTLLGLVRHMAEVERGWFRIALAGEALPFRWVTDERPDGEFEAIEGADVAPAFAAWNEECQRSRGILAQVGSLADTFRSRAGTEFSVRWLLTHMIEEYARHNGHADLLRQRLDGQTGE